MEPAILKLFHGKSSYVDENDLAFVVQKPGRWRSGAEKGNESVAFPSFQGNMDGDSYLLGHYSEQHVKILKDGVVGAPTSGRAP